MKEPRPQAWAGEQMVHRRWRRVSKSHSAMSEPDHQIRACRQALALDRQEVQIKKSEHFHVQTFYCEDTQTRTADLLPVKQAL